MTDVSSFLNISSEAGFKLRCSSSGRMLQWRFSTCTLGNHAAPYALFISSPSHFLPLILHDVCPPHPSHARTHTSPWRWRMEGGALLQTYQHWCPPIFYSLYTHLSSFYSFFPVLPHDFSWTGWGGGLLAGQGEAIISLRAEPLSARPCWVCLYICLTDCRDKDRRSSTVN